VKDELMVLNTEQEHIAKRLVSPDAALQPIVCDSPAKQRIELSRFRNDWKAIKRSDDITGFARYAASRLINQRVTNSYRKYGCFPESLMSHEYFKQFITSGYDTMRKQMAPDIYRAIQEIAPKEPENLALIREYLQQFSEFAGKSDEFFK
jgi:hypothetical protein